jgi:hypothetical protein
MKLITHIKFKIINCSREEKINFNVQANYDEVVVTDYKLLKYSSLEGIDIVSIVPNSINENESRENPIPNSQRKHNVLNKYKEEAGWEENLKYNCHYYSFFQSTGYWLNDIHRFLEVNKSKYKRKKYTDDVEIIENDIILFVNEANVIIHSCRFEGNEFIHKCGARGVHKFETLDGWKDCNECDYVETSYYEICTLIKENKN